MAFPKNLTIIPADTKPEKKPLPAFVEPVPQARRKAERKTAPQLERPGFGPFNLAKGAKVETLITDWPSAVLALADEDWIGLDLETSGLSPWHDYITVVGLYGPSKQVAAVIHTQIGIPEGLLRWLNIGHKFVTQNGVAFDIPFLANAGMDVFKSEWFDTLIGEQVVITTGRQGVKKDLQSLVKRRLDIDISKTVDHRDWLNDVLTDQQVRYVAEDISFLPALKDAQYARAREVSTQWGNHPFYGTNLTDALDFEMQLAPVVIQMELNGLPIDEVALFEYYDSQVEIAAAAKVELDKVFGEINWRSHVQIKKAFKEKLDVTLHSTQEDELKDVRDLFIGSPVVSVIDNMLLFKHADKRAGMYNVDFLEKYAKDGWIHASFRQCGTDTGRFSSASPNLQQIPKNKGEAHGAGMRHVFGNHPEFDIVAVDYSQIEFRVAANEADDAAAIAMFAAGTYDIHTMVASRVFNVPPEAVTKDQRQLSKAMSFTLLFGGGPGLLSAYAKSQGASLPMSKAVPLVEDFFDQFPGLKRMRRRAYSIVDNQRPFTIRQPTGLRRVLVPGKDLRGTLLLNNWVQGTAAAGLKYALLEAHKEGLTEYIGAVVHDEIVSAVPKRYSAEFATKLQAAMIRGMEKVCEKAPVQAEISIGSTWG